MADAPTLDALHAELRQCRRCLEGGHRIESMPVFSGPPTARLMLIGQAPGVTEARSRRPFGGDAGRRLFQWLSRAGWDEAGFRARCYITSVTKCFPGKAASGGGDRVATSAEQKLCRPWLDAELALIKPAVIVPVGMLAIRLFYPPDVKLEVVVGKTIVDNAGRRIVPLPHPSGASRWPNDPRNLGKIEAALFALKIIKVELDL
jgi:uracil-DNA glycosylase family 4